MRDHLITTFLTKNQQLNLSAIRDADWVYLKHIQDSLKLLETGLFEKGKLVIDVGTGGGFPLMPLALSCPECRFLGIDSVRKKTLAVNEMLADLWASNAKVLWTRIEDYQGEQADILTARAVAYADKLLEWSTPLLKKWGHFLLMKQKQPEELEVLHKVCQKKKINLISQIEYQLFEGDIDRVIYILQKQ